MGVQVGVYVYGQSVHPTALMRRRRTPLGMALNNAFLDVSQKDPLSSQASPLLHGRKTTLYHTFSAIRVMGYWKRRGL